MNGLSDKSPPRYNRGITADDIRQLVGSAPIILEVGANDGEDTLAFVATMPEARVYCFEPDPRAIARFRARATDPRILLTEAAIGQHDGTTTFHQSSGTPPRESYHLLPPAIRDTDDWDLSGSIRQPTGHIAYSPWVTFPTTVEVPVCRLDTWMRGHPEIERVDFLWADVQGAEEDLIRGASETLRRTRYFYTEYYELEMYAGQLNLAAIHALLPDFDIAGLYWTDNVLFKNRNLP